MTDDDFAFLLMINDTGETDVSRLTDRAEVNERIELSILGASNHEYKILYDDDGKIWEEGQLRGIAINRWFKNFGDRHYTVRGSSDFNGQEWSILINIWKPLDEWEDD